MATLQSIILSLLVVLFGALFGMDSAKEQDFLYEQFNEILFDQEAPLVDGILVTRVVDGDTIVVTENGEETKVRLLGIDTPETVDPRKEVECFGKEASRKTESLLLNQVVILEADPTQGEIDNYGRLLRYIFLENGIHVNKELIAQGFAYEYTYDLPYKYQSEFKQAEKRAKDEQLGLWGDSCNLPENE